MIIRPCRINIKIRSIVGHEVKMSGIVDALAHKYHLVSVSKQIYQQLLVPETSRDIQYRTHSRPH